MPEITQLLGFEATRAIQTLNELDSAIAGVNRRLKTFNDRANTTGTASVARSFDQIKASATATQTAVDNSVNSFKRAGQSGAKAGNDITVSWETMLRVIQTQLLVRTLNEIIQLFSESADAAEEFQLSVGRIANIARGPGSEIDQLSDTLRDLSVELGRAVPEVTEAAFEALQNDLGSTRETMALLESAANNLSLVTGGTLTQSVNSLSSVIKAYNLDISQADDVTDIFFAAIDKGRISLDELESSLGKITPLAAQLEIPFDQVAAALAAITQSGTNAAVGQTQLRNIFAKLIKPTETLQAVFTKLNVDGFQELQERSGGLQQALEAIEDALDGDEQAIARAFGTIRGQLGVFNLLANEGQIFSETMEVMADRAGRAAEGAAQIDNLDARRSQRAFAELNATLLELGDTTQRLRTAAVETLNAIVSDGQDAEQVISVLGVAVTGLTARFVAARFASLAFLAPLGPLAAGVAAALATAFAADKLSEFISELSNVTDEFKETRIGQEMEVQQAAINATQEIDAAVRNQIEASRNLSSDWRRQVSADYNAVVSAAREANDRIISNAENAIDDFVNARERAVSQIEQAIADIDDRIVDSTQRIADALRSLEEFRFERSLRGLTDQQVAARRLEQAIRAAAEAREAAATAGTDEQAVADARALQNLAKRRAEEALRAADATQNAATIARAERAVEQVITDGIASEKRLRMELREFNQDRLQEQLNAVQTRFEAEEAALKNIIELQKELLDPTADAQAKLINQENLDQAVSKLEDLLKQDFDVDLFKQLGAQNFVDQTTESLLNSFETLDFEMRNVRTAVQEALNSDAFEAVIRIREIVDAPTGTEVVDDVIDQARTADPAQSIQAQEEALIEFIAEQQKANIEAGKLGGIFDANKQQLDSLLDAGVFDQFEQSIGSSGINQTLDKLFAGERFDRTAILEFRDALLSIQEILPDASADTADRIMAQIEEAKTVLRGLLETQNLSEQQALAALDAVKAAEAALQARVDQSAVEIVPQSAVEAAQTRLQQIQNAANQAILGIDVTPLNNLLDKPQQDAVETANSLGQVSQQAAQAASSAGTLATNTGTASTNASTLVGNMNSVVAATNSAVAAANRLAQANARAAQAAAAAASGPRYHGGVVFRQSGGSMTRGQDQLLTALSPGEFVVNARSARNFSSQLQAINAGQQPQFREAGGPVTNIGDVNVSIQTDSTRDLSGRDIAIAVRRELRRNTSSL